jgi:hypothetical protein
MVWTPPGSSRTAAAPTFALSTQTIACHSSSPKSVSARARSIQGFQTTVVRDPRLPTAMRRCHAGSLMKQSAVVSR